MACGGGNSSGPIKHGGVFWQRVPPTAPLTFTDARDYCDKLVVGDRQDWRLPRIDELRTLIVGCPGREAGGSCRVSDPGCLGKDCYEKNSCGHCPEKKGPADGCYWQPGLWQGSCTDTWFYWSSSAFNKFSDHFWVVRFQGGGLFDDGVVGFNEELGQGAVRCVSES